MLDGRHLLSRVFAKLHEASRRNVPSHQQVSLPVVSGAELLLRHHVNVARVPHVHCGWLVIVLSLTMLLVAWLVGREYARRERAEAGSAGGVGAVLAQ